MTDSGISLLCFMDHKTPLRKAQNGGTVRFCVECNSVSVGDEP